MQFKMMLPLLRQNLQRPGPEGNLTCDFSKMMENKNAAVKKLTGGAAPPEQRVTLPLVQGGHPQSIEMKRRRKAIRNSQQFLEESS